MKIEGIKLRTPVLKDKALDFKACMPPVGTMYCNFAHYPEMMQLMKNKPYILPHEQSRMHEILKKYIGTKIMVTNTNEWLVYGEVGQLEKYSLFDMQAKFKLKAGKFGMTEYDFTYANIEKNYSDKLGKTDNGFIVDWIPIKNIPRTYQNVTITLLEYSKIRNETLSNRRVNFNKALSGVGDLVIESGLNTVYFRGLQAYRLFDMRNSEMKKVVSNNCIDYGFSSEDKLNGADEYLITPFNNVKGVINKGLYIHNSKLVNIYKIIYDTVKDKNSLSINDESIIYKDCTIKINGNTVEFLSARVKEKLRPKNISELLELLLMINNETYERFMKSFSSPVVSPNIAYAIKMYTTGSYDDGTEICSIINSKIKDNKKLTIEEYIILRELVNFIDKSVVTEDVVLFRGCKNANDIRYALKSTSFTLDIGYDFASKYSKDSGVINKINIPRGSKAALLTGLSWKGSEDEVLLGIDTGIILKEKLFSYDLADTSPHRYIDVINSNTTHLNKPELRKFINELDNYVYSEINGSRHSKFLIPDTRHKKYEIYVEEPGEQIIDEICFDYTDKIKLILSIVELNSGGYKFVLTITDSSLVAHTRKVQSVSINKLSESVGVLGNMIDTTLALYWQNNKDSVVINKLEYKVREVYSALLNELKSVGAIITRSSISKGVHNIENTKKTNIFSMFEREKSIDEEVDSFLITIGILDINSVERKFKMKIYNRSKYVIEYESSVDGLMNTKEILNDGYLENSMYKIFNYVAFDLRDILESIKSYINDYDVYIRKKRRNILVKKIKSDHATAVYQFGNLIFEQIGQRVYIKNSKGIEIDEINYLNGVVRTLDNIYANIV